MVSQKIVDKRKRLVSKVQAEGEAKRMLRADGDGGQGKVGKLMNVMISERRIKTAAKYKVADIPHPYKTREEYERSMTMPIGEEWNASTVVKNNTAPEIKTRAGRLIEPMKLAKKRKVCEEGHRT